MFRKIFFAFILSVTFGTSCTKDFESINVNPNAPAIVPLEYLLSSTQLMIAGSFGDPGYHTWRANLIYGLNVTQQFSSLSTFYAGDKYLYQADLSEAYFITAYPQAVKNLVNLIELAKADEKDINILSVARILKAFQMHIITDLYGDVPYTEAGRGYFDNNFTPQYDEQQTIYLDMLKELEEAGDALNASSPFPSTADFVYSGDINKWKIFANSLMLRLAMRLQKVDATTAQSWANKALTRGVMTNNDQTFAIHHSEGNTASINANSFNLGLPEAGSAGRHEIDKGSIQWSKTLIDEMKVRNDPRIPIIATLKTGNNAAAAQKGLPSGLDAALLQAATGEIGADNYSRPNAMIYGAADPNMFLTHAEMRFLAAEAISRTWFNGDAAAEYAAGQKAALEQMAAYGEPGTVVAPAAITAYQGANPLPSGSLDAKMEQIHTEIWILTASTLNGYEGWANFRRTGYPVLVPVNYPGNATNGTIPRRLKFPASENGINPNYKIAIDKMGPDEMTTRVWWDKQ